MKSNGSWGGLVVYSAVVTRALASLSYVTIEYGGYDSPTGAAVYADNGTLTATHSLIRNGAGHGLFGTGSGRIHASDVRLTDNGRYALYLLNPAYDLLFTDLVATGNGTDGIGMTGYTYLRGDRLWKRTGIPYVFVGSMGNLAGDRLTLEPGVELRFGNNTGLDVGGQLVAVGLPSAPITFTAVTATPGSWKGINVVGGGTYAVAQFDYATVEYGGYGSSGANVFISSGQVMMKHSLVRYGGSSGIHNATNGNSRTSIETSQIVSNTTFGINNLETNWPILAINNW